MHEPTRKDFDLVLTNSTEKVHKVLFVDGFVGSVMMLFNL